MNRSIICTVGTSLLANAGHKWGEPLPDPVALAESLRDGNLQKASAETNTLQSMEISGADDVVFLHSDTPAGLLCAEQLSLFYKGRTRSSYLKRIGSLGYGAQEFSKGLKSFVDVVIGCVDAAHKEGLTPTFCATGGFKAEIAFLNLLGALLNIEVFYMHEQHRELVRLPRLPLNWDASVVINNQGFFEWIEEEPRTTKEVESRLHQCPEVRTLVEDDGNGYTFLSAAGNLMYKVAKEQHALGPRVTWPPAYPEPADKKNQVSKEEHHRPNGWERFVRRICEIDCVQLVRYDAEAHSARRTKVLDAPNGVIGVVFGHGESNALPLRVETTARGEAQCAAVEEYLRRLK